MNKRWVSTDRQGGSGDGYYVDDIFPPEECDQLRAEYQAYRETAVVEADLLRKENEELIDRFNEQAICAEEFATTMAENAMLYKEISDQVAQARKFTALKCIEHIQNIQMTRSAVVAKIKKEFL